MIHPAAQRNGTRQAPRRVWWLALLCLAPLQTALAAGFSIERADTVLVEKVYQLHADVHIELSEELLDALHNGVVVPIELEIVIARPRDYLWDEAVASLRQRYALEYYALTRQYIVTNLNSGVQESFSYLHRALAYTGTIRSLPLVDAGLLTPDVQHSVSLRAFINVEALPVPLRLLGYFSSGWRLSSEWRSWPL